MGRKRKRSRPLADLLRPAAAAALQFPIGAPVEVRRRSSSSSAAGSESFLEATVVGHQPSGLGYVVELSSRSRGGGSPPRDELIDAPPGDVRPRPPPAPLPREEFAPHDMVEAFRDGGWRPGVVVRSAAVPTTAERPTRRVYEVCLPASREVLEFEEAALRRNRVFREGRWVMAADEAESGTPLFRDGSQVEVSRCEKTFGKCWSPAIILKAIGATSFLVQYRDVREDGEKATETEILDSQYIRPARNISHTDSKFRFTPSSHVEVFHEGSWWTGSIEKVLENESANKYVVKIQSGEVDMDGDLFTVDHTQLRPKLNWYRGQWVRCLTEKPANRGPQLTPCKRTISAALVCSDSGELTDSAPCYLKDKVNDEDIVSVQVSPDLLVCSENDQIKHMASSFPEEVVKQQNTVLLFERHLTVPSQPSLTGLRNLQYDPKLCLSGQLELSSSQRITMPSLPQTQQLQASSFGAFGQLRPLPQGPVSGMQSHAIDFGRTVGSEKAFTDQTKQTNDKGSYLMTGSEPNINSVSSSGTDLSRKILKETVSPQTLELLGESPKIMYKRKRVADKKVEKTSKLAATSEDSVKPNNDNVKDLPRNVDPGSVLLSEGQTTPCIDSRPRKDYDSSKGVSVFLRESSLADEIIPSSRVPIEVDKFHQEDYNGEAQHGATIVSVMIENSELSTTSTLDNSVEEHACPSDSSIQCGNEAANADESAIIMEQGTREEFCQRSSAMDDDANVHLLVSAESCKDIGDSSSVMVKFAAEGSQSIENSEITLLSSIGVSNSTEAEQGDTLIDPKDSERTPISKYVPSRTQGSCLPLLQRSLDLHESIMADIPTESLAIKNLPFMKTSPVWEHLEEMEVFRNVPQQPNFHKFQQLIPELREGMALGLMISFANLAQSIRSLSIDDEDALFKEKMEGLSLLEADGFDVRHLRSRLETLLHIRNGRAELQGPIEDVKRMISHKETDCRHLDPQISVLKMTVRQLELQAYLFRCIMQSAISQKMSDASEIVRLKAEAGTLERSYLSAEQRFSSAATAPW